MTCTYVILCVTLIKQCMKKMCMTNSILIQKSHFTNSAGQTKIFYLGSLLDKSREGWIRRYRKIPWPHQFYKLRGVLVGLERETATTLCNP